ncbi:hypothetical protein [Mesorhizobium sp. L-2-11]|uniref:hypothetical protein n=1 Tax=Mesorhizobium sp. L-2-11 TaxID=2744521 RepID=UPI001927C44F|nr:hypothetical protein [Mesorhizobium sp. L-2-11]BCH15631.1 hypothetical protein MesoLjLa_24820 [Mesorhizobium sp. L-2-11]
MFQPHLKASIRHAFKVPVRFDRDLIAPEGETFFSSGSVQFGSRLSELLLPLTTTLTKAAALEGDGGLSMKSHSET